MRKTLVSISALLLFFEVNAWASLVSPSDPQTARLRVTNQCDQGIWVQQDYKSHTQDGIVIQIPKNQSYDYAIPEKGLASTRFWAKMSCNQHGYDCKVGESTGVPEALDQGIQHGPFAPDINSKFEATWGCIDTIFRNNQNLCAENPSDPSAHIDNNTWWNGSAVDGYTLPYEIKVKNHSGTCVDITTGRAITNPGVNCGGLQASLCPTDENMSTEGAHPIINGVDVTHVNLQWLDPTTQQPVGCFSPCSKMTVAQGGDNGSTAGGWRTLLGGLSPESPEANMYCCPTPPISPQQCSAGPASRSAYHHAVQVLQKCNAYTYAYDDANGLSHCGAQTQFELVFCPKPSTAPTNPEDPSNPPTPPNTNPPSDPTVPPSSTPPAGFSMQFNYNPIFGIHVFVNDTPVENAQVWQSSAFPAQSLLKASQAEKWGSCSLTIGTNTVTAGSGELCSRLNIAKEGTGKVHVYLPADIPNNGVPNDLPSPPPNNTPPAPPPSGSGTNTSPPPATPPAPSASAKYVVFGMNADAWANFKSQVVTNGSKVALDTLGTNDQIELTVHQAQNIATCMIGKVGDTLTIVKETGFLCQNGLVLITQNNGDYYVGIPNPLPVPAGQKAYGLGIAQGMSVTVSGQTISWNSNDKTVHLASGQNNLLITGNNGLTRTCPVSLNDNRLTWPNTSECAGVVENGGILYFPAF